MSVDVGQFYHLKRAQRCQVTLADFFSTQIIFKLIHFEKSVFNLENVIIIHGTKQRGINVITMFHVVVTHLSLDLE